MLDQTLFEGLGLRDKIAFPQRQAVIAERFDPYTDEVLEIVQKDKKDTDLIKDVVAHEDVPCLPGGWLSWCIVFSLRWLVVFSLV